MDFNAEHLAFGSSHRNHDRSTADAAILDVFLIAYGAVHHQLDLLPTIRTLNAFSLKALHTLTSTMLKITDRLNKGE